MREEDRPDDRDIRQRAEGHIRRPWRLDAVVALTQKRRKAEAEKRKLDDELNEALEDTFPASDPVKLTQPDPHPEPDPED